MDDSALNQSVHDVASHYTAYMTNRNEDQVTNSKSWIDKVQNRKLNKQTSQFHPQQDLNTSDPTISFDDMGTTPVREELFSSGLAASEISPKRNAYDIPKLLTKKKS